MGREFKDKLRVRFCKCTAKLCQAELLTYPTASVSVTISCFIIATNCLFETPKVKYPLLSSSLATNNTPVSCKVLKLRLTVRNLSCVRRLTLNCPPKNVAVGAVWFCVCVCVCVGGGGGGGGGGGYVCVGRCACVCVGGFGRVCTCVCGEEVHKKKYERYAKYQSIQFPDDNKCSKGFTSTFSSEIGDIF